LAEVEDWLYGRGIKKDELQYSPAKDWIKLVLTIESAEQLLDTKYSIFRHDDGSLLARTPQWSLPLHLHEYVETIQPTNSFLRPRAKRSGLRVVPMVETSEQYYTPVTNSKPTVAEACNVSGITTQCLRTLYGIELTVPFHFFMCSQFEGTADYRVQSASKSLIGVANYLEETANRSDISIFLQKFRSEAASASQSFKIQTVNGAVDSQSQENSTELDSQLGIEGNLDAETILGITYPTPMIVYNVGGSPPFQTDLVTPTNTNEPYLDWIQFTLNQTALPNVVSQSYGDDEQTVPLSFATAVCKGFAQLGARGATVLFPSGDEGVGASGKCFSNDGKNTSTFLPGFPAGCVRLHTLPSCFSTDYLQAICDGGRWNEEYQPRSRGFRRPK
jgi:tripeptidyl-peptidase-1